LGRIIDGLPDERIKSLVTNLNGYLVPIEGFDEMMVQLNSCLGYELLDKKILSIAKNRADNYRKQFEEIQKSKLSAETSKALDETIKTSKLGWWAFELKASKEKDPNKQKPLYLAGLKKYPNSPELAGNYAIILNNIGKNDDAEKYFKKAIDLDPNSAIYPCNYAVFLYHVRKDYDRAEKYYKKALEIDPNRPESIGNYASFLHRIHKDYENAEKYYKKALEIAPNNFAVLGNYAIFLYEVHKDHDNAKKYYEKALDLLPNYDVNIGNYAKFLIETGNIPKAEEYIDKAFSLQPDRKDLLAELWFYRYAIFPDKYKDAYENIVKLIKSGTRSINWNLKNIIEIAQKRGHKEIETLKKLDKIITEDAPIDILDKP
jgi:Tfp pilus assembly protein PilF